MSRAYAPILSSIQLVPASRGTFDVVLDDEVVFSKTEVGRHAEPGEVMGLLAQRMGPPLQR